MLKLVVAATDENCNSFKRALEKIHAVQCRQRWHIITFTTVCNFFFKKKNFEFAPKHMLMWRGAVKGACDLNSLKSLAAAQTFLSKVVEFYLFFGLY